MLKKLKQTETNKNIWQVHDEAAEIARRSTNVDYASGGLPTEFK